ncbi:hypothetical protein [Flavobacterium sp. ACN6]|uniref:hypothetical protein n=1 Tax=Flavobacterium sp. ACN6 TaxID=1920426 RepID=UPI000BB3637D|nr:hypothetical protein [Flavobacterium sp. ACN6]PBJ16132.1 hypothetical protein BSF42_05360 [Flavobacterium sp. ACN6]
MEKTIITELNAKTISVLKKVLQLQEENREQIREFYKKEIVAFSILGIPINKVDYKEELKNAKLEIINGNIVSQEELECESRSW